MFITVTRSGGPFALRVAAAAIASIGKMPDGAILQLISGEHMRVDDEPGEIERLVIEALMPAPADPAIALVEARLGVILDRLEKHGMDVVPPLIDEEKEKRALDLAEANGLVDGVQAAEQRVERVVRRGRGRRS